MPKSLLPLPTGETLLSRLLFQLGQAGICDIVISTRPELKLAFDCCVDTLLQSEMGKAMRISVLSNSEHAVGPVPALARAVKESTLKRSLLCLPDIYYARNPFISSLMPRGFAVSLLVGPVKDGRSGFVRVSGTRVVDVQYVLSGTADRCQEGYNWTGAAIMNVDALLELIAFSNVAEDAPLDDFFNRLAIQSRSVTWFFCGPFVNVNSFESLIECASLQGS